MPFIAHVNKYGSYRVENAETGRVYAYNTLKPAQVISIVRQKAGEISSRPPKRKSGRRK